MIAASIAGTRRQSKGGKFIRPIAAAGICTRSVTTGMKALVAMKFSDLILRTHEKLKYVIPVNSAPPTNKASKIVGP